MATLYPQRAVAIVDAALGGPATQSQRDRVAAAFASALPPNATQTQIAEQLVKAVHQFLVDRVLAYETQAGIIALREGKLAEVVSTFTELP